MVEEREGHVSEATVRHDSAIMMSCKPHAQVVEWFSQHFRGEGSQCSDDEGSKTVEMGARSFGLAHQSESSIDGIIQEDLVLLTMLC